MSLATAPGHIAARTLVIAVLALFCAQPSHARPQQSLPRTSLDPEQYVAELERLSTRVTSLEVTPENVAALRREIPAKWHVEPSPGDQTRFEVPTGWFTSALSDMERSPRLREPLRRDLLARLAALHDEAVAYQSAAATDGVGDARAALEKILNRREFRSVHGPTWWDLLRQRAANWFQELLRKILGPLTRMPLLSELVLWLLVTLVFVVLALWIKRTWLRPRAEPSLQLSGARPEDRNWRHWAREAIAAAARGDHREAVHRAYWAGVFRLEELGLWEPDRSRTPREYLRLVPRSHAHREPLAALTRRFELIWYGRQSASAADFQQAVANLESMGCLFPSKLATGKS